MSSRAALLVLCATAVGCGPPVASIEVFGDLGPAVWDAVGNEPATLLARVDLGDPAVARRHTGGREVEVLAALCPGDEQFDRAYLPLWAGCPLPIEAEVWLVPDGQIPFTGEPPEPGADGCDPGRAVPLDVDPSFTADGWPHDTLFAFENADGNRNRNPMAKACKNFERDEVELE